MKIETVDISSLSAYKNNAKEHPADQVAQIAASIEAFGFNDPIAIDENGIIIEGHGRLMAAKMLGMSEVPIIRLEHLNDTEKRAYIIAHNKLTMNSGFDERMLAKEIQSLVDDGFDFGLTGFLEDEIEELGVELENILGEDKSDDDSDDDYVPVHDDDHICIKTGDMIDLGYHRLCVGDSGDIDTVRRLMGEELADMSISDPPYGVAYIGKTKDSMTIQNDDLDESALRDYVEKWYDGVDAAVKRGGVCAGNGSGGTVASNLCGGLEATGVAQADTCLGEVFSRYGTIGVSLPARAYTVRMDTGR